VLLLLFLRRIMTSAFAAYQNQTPETAAEETKAQEILDTHAQFIERARKLAAEEFNERFASAQVKVSYTSFYVVWFSKTLQNWKALVSTDLISGQYWEITYNGDKKETYVDAYVKFSNRAVPDGAVS
jgi:hypothetical protein